MEHYIFALIALYVATRLVKAVRVFIYGGRVIDVTDGDTIVVRRWFFIKQKIRLAEIDAPEKSQPGGRESKEELIKILPVGARVVLASYGRGTGRHNRKIAHVYSGLTHANLEMISRGHAWRYTQYSRDANLQRAQLKAKRKKRGLWRKGKAIAPWEFRKKGR